MASDIGSAVRDALGGVVRDALKSAGDAKPGRKAGPLSGAKGVAAGAALAAAAPLARKGVAAVKSNGASMAGKAASKASDDVGSGLKDVVSRKIDDAGGASGLVKDAASGLIGGGDDGGGGSGGMPGVGKGRRMPVQQGLTVGVPIETAYNQWTQFEDWPQFMHRVTRASHKDDTAVSFAVKIWGKTKEFEAQIITMRPDERIKWKVTQGISHSGVVTFHELGPRLTRIELDIDVDPGSLVEKAARGMRHVKRAVRADMARYKAFIEMQEHETGAWRGVIEDGELVEDHDDTYDEGREYSEVDDIYEDAPEDQDEPDDEEEFDEPQAESGSDEDEDEDEGQERQPSNGRAKARPPARSRGGASSGNGRAKATSRSTARAKPSSGRAKPSGSRSGGGRRQAASRS
jgi:uncharacterized membrane protein